MKKVAKSKKDPKAEHVVEQKKASLQPKKKGSEIPKAEHVVVVEPKKKASLQPKKKGSEIDEIFAGKKRKRLENENKAGDEKPTKANVRPLDRKREKGVKSRSFKPNSSAVGTSQSRKKTADGLSVFSEEELGIGKPDAGGTALCPFDCDCCF